MKQWLTVKEIAGLPGVPTTPRAVRIKADKENWTKRKATKGKAFEYKYTSLTEVTQAYLLRENTEAHAYDLKPELLGSEELWENYEVSSTKKKTKAQNKLLAVQDVLAYIESGLTKGEAFAAAAKEHNVTERSLYNYHKKVKDYPRTDWLAVLVPLSSNGRDKAVITDEAWAIFKADYLRPEAPFASSCYYRLQLIAEEKGWTLPSVKTFQRRIDSEVSKRVQILRREGKEALMRTIPAQRRTVKDLEALEWINGDGYQHNVFVLWPNGEIQRPKTWVWQDIYSRKILAYRVDVTENTDVLRLSFGDLIDTFGIPKTVTIDNTRAAANKVMTGGLKNRYRFKVKEDEADGIFKLLNIDVKWTSVNFGKGHGQAKPVERIFGTGGLGDIVDRHPKLQGAYTGPIRKQSLKITHQKQSLSKSF